MSKFDPVDHYDCLSPGDPAVLGSMYHYSKEDEMKSLAERIHRMNTVFQLPTNNTLTDQGEERLEQFVRVFKNEITELEDVYVQEDDKRTVDFVALADCFADLQVYLKSEAQRWGIPLDDITHLVLDSQDSKLVDGKPLMAPDNSKFIKGPDYQPPEKKIAEKLITHFNNYNSISEKALIRSRYLDN